MLRGLIVVTAFTALGELAARATSAPLPGAVLGLVALLVALRGGLVRRAIVAEACQALTGRMALFLVPAAVEVFDRGELLQRALVPVVAASALSTLLVLALVGRAAGSAEAP